jgi:hypothetical protein
VERELQKLLSLSFGQETDNREIQNASLQTERKPELPTYGEVRVAIQFMKSRKEPGAAGHQQKYIAF